jgi:hypothetical protein
MGVQWVSFSPPLICVSAYCYALGFGCSDRHAVVFIVFIFNYLLTLYYEI